MSLHIYVNGGLSNPGKPFILLGCYISSMARMLVFHKKPSLANLGDIFLKYSSLYCYSLYFTENREKQNTENRAVSVSKISSTLETMIIFCQDSGRGQHQLYPAPTPVTHATYCPGKPFGLFSPQPLVCKMGSNLSALDQETGSTGSCVGFSYQG